MNDPNRKRKLNDEDDDPNELKKMRKNSNKYSNFISATDFFNYFMDDPILDILNKHGEEYGFMPDPRPDHVQTIFDKGYKFEDKVVEILNSKFGSKVMLGKKKKGQRRKIIKAAQISHIQGRDWDVIYKKTLSEMNKGIPIITQAGVLNKSKGIKGRVDLLVRSDYLNLIRPKIIGDDDQKIGCVFSDFWHYRVVDIKMSNLPVTCNNLVNIRNDKKYRAYKIQVLAYNLCLEEMQKYFPSSAYLLGRGAKDYDGAYTVNNCFQSMSEVDFVDFDKKYIKEIEEALKWLRYVNNSQPEDFLTSHKSSLAQNLDLGLKSLSYIRPNMKNTYDSRWHSAKREIAERICDPTLIWNVGVKERAKAFDMGSKTWQEYPTYLRKKQKLTDTDKRIEQIIKVNMNTGSDNFIIPNKLRKDVRDSIPCKGTPYFVLDFETASNLSDDFTSLPNKGGSEIIFLIGCIFVDENGLAEHKILLTDYLDHNSESKILIEWINWIDSKQKKYVKKLPFYHWSHAEFTFIKKAHERHGFEYLVNLELYDLLKIFKSEPILIKGAFNYGLKNIVKAMNQHKMVNTIWDNDMDGLTAMFKIIEINQRAVMENKELKNYPEALEIKEYNRTDCVVLVDIITFLQKKYLN